VQQSFLKEKDIQVINNGVDLKSFSALAKGNNEKFHILGVSSVWPQSKGLLDFYELRKLLPVDEFAITLVGLTPQQIQELPSGITGMTRTNSVQELAGLYSMADVLVNPTYADSFPTVNMEALASGTPVITYQTGGSPEIVDERTGVVVPQGDVKAIASAVQSLKQHPLSSEVCRRRAEDCFDKDKCFEKYISLYKKYI
jgi:glycosyltransferase involved in cell wall biosynthesis